MEATLLDVAQGLALSPRTQGLALSPVRETRPYKPARTSLYHTPLTTSGDGVSLVSPTRTRQSYHLSPTHPTLAPGGTSWGTGGGDGSVSPDAWQVSDVVVNDDDDDDDDDDD